MLLFYQPQVLPLSGTLITNPVKTLKPLGNTWTLAAIAETVLLWISLIFAETRGREWDHSVIGPGFCWIGAILIASQGFLQRLIGWRGLVAMVVGSVEAKRPRQERSNRHQGLGYRV